MGHCYNSEQPTRDFLVTMKVSQIESDINSRHFSNNGDNKLQWNCIHSGKKVRRKMALSDTHTHGTKRISQRTIMSSILERH